MNMVNYFPVMLDLQDQRIVVIGGGAVAERKVGPLLEAGAAVTVVSPSLTERLSELAEKGMLIWISRPYAPGDLEGAFLLMPPAVMRRLMKQLHGRQRLWAFR